MKLDSRAFTATSAVLTAILYAVCFGFYAAAPEGTSRFFSYVLHLDMTGFTRMITWGSFFSGLVFWTVISAVCACLFTWVYNRLVEGLQAPAVRRERARA